LERNNYTLLVARIAYLLPLALRCVAAPTAVPIPEELFRQHAIDAPIPAFPVHSGRTNFEGRVVVAVAVTGRGGQISTLKVLESPDASFARATEVALSRWRFRPFTDTGPALTSLLLSARLVFYFSSKGGREHVTDAVFEVLEHDRRRSETENAARPSQKEPQPR
jgi:hypothetical protein